MESSICSSLTLSEQLIPEQDIIGDVLYEVEQAAKRGNVSQLFFKKKLFFETPADSEDQVEKDLLFYQSVWDVVNERYPIANERDAIKLAACQVHINYGEFDESKAAGVKSTLSYVDLVFFTLSRNQLDKYIPKRLQNLHTNAEWAELISNFHSVLKGKTNIEIKDVYRKQLKAWPLYGASIFNVKQSTSSKLPKDLWVAVHPNAFHLLAPYTEVKETFFIHQGKQKKLTLSVSFVFLDE